MEVFLPSLTFLFTASAKSCAETGMMETQKLDQQLPSKLHYLDFSLLTADKVFQLLKVPGLFGFLILHDKGWIMLTYIKRVCKCMQIRTSKRQLT